MYWAVNEYITTGSKVVYLMFVWWDSIALVYSAASFLCSHFSPKFLIQTPHGEVWDVFCEFKGPIYVPHVLLLYSMQYAIVMDRVIKAPDCNCLGIPCDWWLNGPGGMGYIYGTLRHCCKNKVILVLISQAIESFSLVGLHFGMFLPIQGDCCRLIHSFHA